MTDYNEFNWDEEESRVPEPQTRPVYTESVLKPKSPKRRSGHGRLIAGVICGALAGSLISTTAVIGLSTFFPKTGNVTIYEGSGRAGIAPDVTQISTVVTDNAGQELSTEEIAQLVGPAVVGISCNVSVRSIFGVQQGVSSGSGIVISDQGHIVTNYHVIDGADSITVNFSTGEQLEATLVGGDEQTDLAVLKIEPIDTMKIAVLGDSDAVEVGERAIAIGNPMADELFGTVTQGIISGKNRTIRVNNREMTLLQTDAAINPGNSGGALINKYGEIIGINSAKISSSSYSGTSSEGLGFAIPINEAKPIIRDIIDYGFVRGRPIIGVTVQQVTEEIAYYYNLPVNHGLLVMGLTAGGAAAEAGIQRGDIIVSFDGQEVKTSTELNNIRDQHKAGEVIPIEIDRNGERITLNITLGEDSSNKLN
ncbi:MAG: trypsin-like peptidase domain-containing protein [Oscillospiraceae bacterium]|nr:trypsin-like peptidase domain-containing protein [Oscillospiraceae bacterium]